MSRDRLGRRRQPDQERGLRSLHPELPEEWSSRAIRVAMSERDWALFESLALRLAPDAETQARAFGQVLSHLLRSIPEVRADQDDPLDWQDWERRKTLRLLFAAAARHAS